MRLQCALLALLLIGQPALADRVAELPDAWQGRLEAIPELDLQGAEPAAREAILAARSELDRLLTRPDTPSDRLAAAWGRLAALYELTGVDRGARIAWQNARRLEPERFRWAYYAGRLALARGELDRAEEALGQAARLNPDYPPLALQLGRLALAQGRLDEAQRHLEDAGRHEGLRAAALYYLGQLALLRHRPREAVERLEAALELAPEADAVHYALAQAWRALGDRDKARKHLARFRHRKLPRIEDPLASELNAALDSARTRFRLAMEAVRRHDYASAVKRFREGLAREPGNLHARISLARVLYLDGHPELAEAELRKVAARPDAPPLARFLLAVLEEGRGHVKTAREGYETVLSRDPDHPGARYALANLLFRTGRYREAAREYERALAADPRILPARLLAVIALARAGEPEAEIARRLESLHQEQPDDARIALALIRLRSLARDPAVRKPDAALALANALATAHPAPPNIEALALAAAAAGQFEDAVRLEQQAIDLLAWQAPPDILARALARLAAYRAGRMPEEPVFPDTDPIFQPPPLDVTAVFRDYPAARPY